MCFVTWRWKPNPGYRSTYGPETVRILRNMLKRHYAKPHRFVCVTDTPKDIDTDIETLPLWKDWADIPSPHGGHNPSCYRRLKAFSADAAKWFGPRFASLDLDTVIVRDVTPVFDRPEDFVCFGETDPRSYYNGSFFLLTAGARRQVYDSFNPATSPQQAKAAGRFGSDQGHLSHVLGPGEAIWTPSDGVYSFRVHLKNGATPLPENARLISFHGGQDPWGPQAKRIPWVKRHYQ
jgi:hypothetical protein